MSSLSIYNFSSLSTFSSSQDCESIIEPDSIGIITKDATEIINLQNEISKASDKISDSMIEFLKKQINQANNSAE